MSEVINFNPGVKKAQINSQCWLNHYFVTWSSCLEQCCRFNTLLQYETLSSVSLFPHYMHLLLIVLIALQVNPIVLSVALNGLMSALWLSPSIEGTDKNRYSTKLNYTILEQFKVEILPRQYCWIYIKRLQHEMLSVLPFSPSLSVLMVLGCWQQSKQNYAKINVFIAATSHNWTRNAVVPLFCLKKLFLN